MQQCRGMLEMAGSADDGTMVWTPGPATLKAMVSAPGLALASSMRSCKASAENLIAALLQAAEWARAFPERPLRH